MLNWSKTQMADIVSKEQRSRNMAAIQSKNTKPEIYIRKKLFAHGYRYRIASTEIPGHPDLYFSKYHTAMFINGCFWHRHENCRFAYTPKSNVDFWEQKFKSNVHRDSEVQTKLHEAGVRCLIIWECTYKKMLKDPEYNQQIIEKIECFLKGTQEKMSL